MPAPAYTVTFLGTSSGVPTLQRNLSSVAIQREGELFLFDCGEAAQIQYRRAGLGFAPLAGICVTHLHGDHVTGLMGLLMSLQMAERIEPLAICGPPGIREYVRLNRRALHTRFAYPIQFIEADTAAVLREADGYRLLCAPLEHRLLCLGFALMEKPRPGRFNLEAARVLGIPEGPLYGRLQSGEPVSLPDGRTVLPEQVLGPPRPGASVAFCTDTRPCAAAVDLARDTDLLIYEGTFDASSATEAHRKGHSTVAEAAQIALAAGVRRLAITHLSPRYRDVEPLLEQARAIFPNTLMARDLMQLEVYRRDEEPAGRP
ncbi:MAG: ribonuclease Z [Armatimonadetes bacterium]|nr:ribonuclease Z [Armatimonadota bacterium]